MRGALYGYHFSKNGNHWQCYADGKHGRYVIRQYRTKLWWAIMLWSLIGCIAGEGESAEEAFGNAERTM